MRLRSALTVARPENKNRQAFQAGGFVGVRYFRVERALDSFRQRQESHKNKTRGTRKLAWSGHCSRIGQPSQVSAHRMWRARQRQAQEPSDGPSARRKGPDHLGPCLVEYQRAQVVGQRAGHIGINDAAGHG